MSLTSSASSTSSINQLQQFRIDGLSGLLQHPDQLTGLAEVPRSEEGVCCAFVGAAGRATDAMDVVLRWVGIVIIDDKLDILHILTFEAVVGLRRGGAVGSVRDGKDKNTSQNKTDTGWEMNQSIYYFRFCAFGSGNIQTDNTCKTPILSSSSAYESITYLLHDQLVVQYTIRKWITYHANCKTGLNNLVSS